MDPSPPRCPSPPQEPPDPRKWPQKLPARGHTQLRNRRYGALRELIREGDYFSEERMRLRAPGLFHHYIGRFRDPKTAPKNPKTAPKKPQSPRKNPEMPQNGPEMPQNGPEIAQNRPKIAQNGPEMAQNGAGRAPGLLRELLLTALEESHAQEEEEEEEDEDEDEEGEERVPDEAERELLRLEFTSRMYQSFLEGQDGDFDYSQVDENPDLDNLDLLSRDLEDRYFDEEEPGPAPPLL